MPNGKENQVDVTSLIEDEDGVDVLSLIEEPVKKKDSAGSADSSQQQEPPSMPSETSGEEVDPFANIESPVISEDPLLTIKREKIAQASEIQTSKTGTQPQSPLERNISVPKTQEEKIANDYLAQNLTDDELYRAGYGKFERGDVNGAQELFQLSLNKNPQNPKALQGLGSVALTKEDYQGAYDSYSKAVNLLPKTVILADGKEYKNEEYLSTLQGLSTAMSALGMGEESLQVAETLLSETPDSYVAWQAKSNAERVLGNTQAADDDLKKAKDLWVQNLPVPSIYDQFDEYQKNLETRAFAQQLKPGFDELKERAGQFVASALNPAEYAAQNLAGIENGLTEMKHGFDRMSSLAPYDQFVGTLQALGGGAEVGISGVMLTPQGWAFTQGIGALDVLTYDAASQVIFAPLQTLVGEPRNEDVAVGLKLFDTVVGLAAFGAAHKAMRGDAAGAKQINDAATKFKNKEPLTGEEVKLLTETVQQNATKDTFKQLQSALEEIPKEAERPIELAAELTTLTERYKQLEKKQEGKIEPIKQKIEAEKKEVGEEIKQIVSPKEKGTDNINLGVDVGEEMRGNKFPSKKQVLEFLEDEEGRHGGEFIGENGRFQTTKQARRYAGEVHSILSGVAADDYIPIYRVVKAAEVDLEPFAIGESWSFDLNAVKEYARQNLNAKTNELKIISAYVPRENVNWEAAVRQYHNFSDIFSSESEFEIPITPNSKLLSVKVSEFKEAKELPNYIPVAKKMPFIEAGIDEGAIFYSPNEGNLTFTQAAANLKTKEHKAFRDATDSIDRELGLETKHEDAIGDWVDGAENSVFAEITNVKDFETLRYSAALKGRMANQKAVIPFKTDRNGSDILYMIEVPESVASVRKKLNDAGIQFRTLIPRGKKDTKVVIFDPGRANADLVKKFTQDNGYKTEFKQGTGEFIEGETREAATGIYNEIISAYESGRNLDLGNRYNRREYQQRLSDISAEQVKPLQSALDRLNKAKQKSKEVRSRQSNVGAIKDPFREAKEQAEADRELLNAYVDVAKEYVKEKGTEVIKSVQDFAKLIGEEVNEIIEKAYRVFKDESKVDDEIPIPKREEIEATGDVTLVAANEKAVLKHLVDSRNISERAKKNLEDEGLKYKPKSQEDARFLAEEIVKGVGENAAVAYAESGRFESTINSLIFATSIDRIAKREAAARAKGDTKTADSLASKWADFAIRYSDAAQSGGRFISAIYDFYKKSPLGIKIREQKNREKAFENWFKSKEEAYKEFWDELTKVPQFQQVIKAGAESYKAAAKKLADNVRKLKTKPLELRDENGNPIIISKKGIDWNDLVEGIAKSIEAVGSIADGIIKYLEKQEWYEALTDKGKSAVQKQLTEHFEPLEKKKITKKDEDKIVKKWSEKLKGLPESKKEKFIRDVVRAVVEKGELKYADFKKLLEEATGLGKITEAESRMMEKYVETTNRVTELADEVQKNPTPENIREYDKAVEAAERAGTDLGNILYREPNLTNRFTSLVSLNTLGLGTLIKNIGYNVAQQAFIRFPKALLGTALDYTAYGISLAANKPFGTPILKPDTNVLLAQKGYFKGLGTGTREAFAKIRRGATHKDYFKQGIQQSPIKPLQSMRDLKAWNFGKGDKILSRKEIFDRVLQIYPGALAEVIGRGLFLGDNPPRWAAEMSRARQIAQLKLGIKDGKELDLFVRFPEQQARQHFERKGATPEQAQKKAEDVVNQVKEAGDDATLTMDNLLTELITTVKNWGENQASKGGDKSLANTVGRVLGVLSVPYLKIPINAAWLAMNIRNPILPFAQSAYYGFQYAKTKDPAMARKAKDWLSVTALSVASNSVAAWMASNEIITPRKTDEDQKKESATTTEFSRQYSLNLSKLLRGGGETQDGDINIDLSWFGSQGAILNVAAQQRNKELEEGEMEGMDELWYNLSEGGINGFTESVFGGTASIINAYTMGGGYVNQLGNQWAGMLMNVFEPAMIAQTSRYGFGRQLDTRGDTFGESLSKEIYERSFGAVGKKPETSLGVFGEPQVKEGSMFGRVLTGTLGLEIADTDKLGYTIYEMYNQTHNDDLVPPSPPKTISVDGVKTPLTYYQQRDLQAQIGAARLEIVGAFLNNQASVYVKSEEDWKYMNDMTIEEVAATLKKMYDKGSEIGHDRFKLIYPEFMSQKDLENPEQEPQATEEVLEGMEIK